MAPLLAQFNGPNNNAAADDDIPPELLIPLLAGVCVFLLVFLVVYVLFLLCLQKALARCHPDNRAMNPGSVWLNLVPCLNVVWQFLTVIWVADSLDREFRDRRLRGDGDYGKGIGLASCVLNLLGNIPYIGLLFGLAGLVCFVVYWVKIAGLSRQLAEDDAGGYDDDRPGRDRDDDRYDDEYDDRPRGRDRDDGYDDDRPRR